MEQDTIPAKSFAIDQQHASYVTSDTGTSPIEILYVLLSISITPLLTSLLIPWIVPSNFIPMSFGDSGTRNVVRSLIEYPIMGILPLLTITVLAGHAEETEAGFYQQLSYCLPTVLTLSCIGIVIVNHSITNPTWNSIKTQWVRIQDKIITPLIKVQSPTTTGKKKNHNQVHLPFVTTFRAMIIYVTILSILAVDFTIFPRRFAKTKVFGFSLMDVGTGSFIFANGIVSPEARRMRSNLRQSLISSVPLILLGFIRLVTVKGSQYQEVVEEYGVHWNFFFTLAMVKISSALIFRLIHPKHSIKLGFAIGLAYDYFLVHTGFQNDYLLNPSISRETSLTAGNREGLFSTVGYTCIYCLSIYCGQLLYHGHIGRSRFRDWLKYALVSGIQIVFLWTLVYYTHSHWNPCSRRAGNLAYVLWAVGSNYTILWFHVVFYLIQTFLQHSGLIYGPLLFHQLESSAKESKARKLRADLDAAHARLAEDSKEKEAPTELELIALEGKLGLIEDKLKKKVEDKDTSRTAESQKELEELAEEMEKELKSVRDKTKQRNPFENAVKEMKDREKNVAYLPDLTVTPVTAEAICYNGLFIFLLGNLLTGIINLSVVAMYTRPLISLVILWTYATLIVGIGIVLYFYQIRFKFW